MNPLRHVFHIFQSHVCIRVGRSLNLHYLLLYGAFTVVHCLSVAAFISSSDTTPNTPLLRSPSFPVGCNQLGLFFSRKTPDEKCLFERWRTKLVSDANSSSHTLHCTTLVDGTPKHVFSSHHLPATKKTLCHPSCCRRPLLFLFQPTFFHFILVQAQPLEHLAGSFSFTTIFSFFLKWLLLDLSTPLLVLP